jgi:hypothetical protein
MTKKTELCNGAIAFLIDGCTCKAKEEEVKKKPESATSADRSVKGELISGILATKRR